MKKKTKVHQVKKIKKVIKHGDYLCRSYIQIISVIVVLAIVLITTVKMTASSQVLGVSIQANQGRCNGQIFCK